MGKFELVLLIHAHQPVGNFDDVMERAYAASYVSFLEVLERHPAIRLGLHYSGPLLEWIERAHPEYFDRLRRLIQDGQVEIVGGGFYEPILVTIPPEDRQEQIRRLAAYLARQFGTGPRGAWLAERVWEPQLPSSLAQAGVEYTLVDDHHFLGSGFEPSQLYGYYLCEDLGHSVKVLPGLKALRYLIPFREVRETIEFLRSAAARSPEGFATMGDDLEKFGVWPGTFDHCYRDGWLEHFFTVLEQNADWLALSLPGEAIASHPPLGRADLPTASYTEMSEWALPTPARGRYHALLQEFSPREDALPFLRGGIWRGFFSKYSEANLLHKKMLHVSRKLRNLSPRRGGKSAAAREEALTLLLRGQCNDAYWHGVFGGLYSPHLRTAVWRPLVEAEARADRIAHRRRRYADVAQLDFDADGRDELYFTANQYAALLSPSDGATMSAIDFRTPAVALVNSLQRRLETYHAKLRTLPSDAPHGVQTIHEQTRAKEAGLERWLRYDRWRRNAFRLLLFERNKTLQDYCAIQLNEDPMLAGAPYRVADAAPSRATLVSESSADWTAEKRFSLLPTGAGFKILCEVILRRQAPGAAAVNIGIEAILNFLAPANPDRYFESDGQRYPLRWTAAVAGTAMRVVDEWQRVCISLEAPFARQFWLCPIETVSESEDGFERIYQGSQLMPVWPAEVESGGEWTGQLVFEVAEIS